MHATAPYFHDGSAATLEQVFRTAGGTVYQAEDGVLSGSVERPNYVNINYFNQVQKGGLVQWNGAGSVTFASIPAGSTAGVGSIELRFTAGGSKNITVRVNSTNYPLTLVGQNPGWQFDHYLVARLENVNFVAGNNSVVISSSGDGFGIDSMTVSTPSNLLKATPHRRVLSLSASDQANLIRYLQELDGSSIAAIVDPGSGGGGTGGLAQFRRDFSLAIDGSQDAQAPAGDGVANLLKFAFNMFGNGPGQTPNLSTPNASVLANDGSSGLPFVSVDGNGKLQITYLRRKTGSNPGISYSVEFSETLSAWAVDLLATESTQSINDSLERVTVRGSSTNGRSIFARVRVAATP